MIILLMMLWTVGISSSNISDSVAMLENNRTMTQSAGGSVRA